MGRESMKPFTPAPDSQRPFQRRKILGDGELTRKLTVSAQCFSAQRVRRSRLKAGSCEVIAPKKKSNRAKQPWLQSPSPIAPDFFSIQGKRIGKSVLTVHVLTF